MQMTYLKIEKQLFSPNEAGGAYLTGTVEFTGDHGKMVMVLNGDDVVNIQQLLMKKTKDLASEA